jgi:hypothetical protein
MEDFVRKQIDVQASDRLPIRPYRPQRRANGIQSDVEEQIQFLAARQVQPIEIRVGSVLIVRCWAAIAAQT